MNLPPSLGTESSEPDQLWPTLDQYPAEEVTAYPVGALVNSVNNNSSELIVPRE